MQKGYINYNGKIVKAGEAVVSADNRGFRYGDGIFETIKVKAGKIMLWSYHRERLLSGLSLLQIHIPAFFTGEYIEQQILNLCKKNNHQHARVRLMVFRGDGGLYDFENHFSNYLIQTWELSETYQHLNENGLDIGVYSSALKSTDVFSNLKSNNYLPYIMAALFAKENKWNDCLVLNDKGRICDATIANFFMMKEGKVFTPTLSEGCVAGIMRRHLIEQLPGLGYEVVQTSITMEDLKTADEIWLTNAIQGLRWVKRIGDNVYQSHHASIIFSKLLQTV